MRHFTVRPWIVATAGSVLCAMAIGYLAATSYLVFRDDLIGAAGARQAHMQQAYEDRIAALRTQVDRITSRQLLDQQVMERKVGELLKRQDRLTRRHGRLDPVLKRAEAENLAKASAIPVPTPRPDEHARLEDANGGLRMGIATANAFAPTETTGSISRDVPWPTKTLAAAASTDDADRLFASISSSLSDIETEQIRRVARLAENAYASADEIASALQTAGVDLPAGEDDEAMGGPYVPLDDSMGFDTRVQELGDALDRLDTVKAAARKLPLRVPAPGVRTSSGFGARTDPFLHRPAFHAGLDFLATTGSLAHATAGGTVTRAGRAGGYGNMVQIDHGNGYVTRYAHLSAILVGKGDIVTAGEAVGRVGSTGRSTGPHLHYEVRRNGKAVDPVTYLRAGRKIAKYL